ncbi:MAG: DUF4012 domain-containing protein [Candidatus Andersenbacteria bacterium]|nr:DUF4012 domain-containing protein [Candidatus Andersenbacteria bacterium]MBI3251081.1 DUF4012 domain-containing protein [Candidatus Andersenbacteria bacterium]
MQGQQVLAQGDFAAGQESFGEANVLVQEAQGQLHDALSSSQTVLQFLDVSGTVKSGDSMLAATAALAQAGEHTASGLEILSQEKSLSEAVTTALPDIRSAAEQLGKVEEALSHVNDGIIPATVQPQFMMLKTLVPQARVLLDRFLSQADTLLYLLGTEHDRQYLVLLANNHELRPVGGFIGTTALVNVDRGEVEQVDVASVYDGDGQLKQFIAPPDPLSPIVDRWYLRDSNWFVDFKTSAQKAAELFEKEGGPTVDGVILMTPEVIREILEFTGPIAVPGYDQPISADTFVEVTQREVTYEYDRQINRPKQFLADLTPILLEKLFTGSDNKLQVLGALTRSLSKKDLLLSFRDEAAQEQVEQLGWAGSLPVDAPGFLHVNNANIGGHKSDEFIEQEIDYRVQVDENGQAQATVTIRRTHNGPTEKGNREFPIGDDPTQKDNIIFQRVLVPSGSQLLEAKGFSPRPTDSAWGFSPPQPPDGVTLEADADLAVWQSGQQHDASGTIIGKEAGYTMFGNWIVTEPGQTSVVLYRYQLPTLIEMPGLFKPAASTSFFVAKQSGANRTSIRTEFALPVGYRVLHTIPDTGITRESDEITVYRGDLSTDKLFGIVFEKASRL